MKTLLKIGPNDHGRPITDRELCRAELVSGYKYELINGRVYVTYEPDPPEDMNEKWLLYAVRDYTRDYPEVINYVTNKARIFVPGAPRLTIPEPDLAAYHAFPKRGLQRKIRWREVSPILVGEIVSANDPHKDLIRNVQLYLRVPSIKEYWVLDGRMDPDRPTLLVYRRRGSVWQPVIEIQHGETYTTRLLPGFQLPVDPLH
jgi:Uma2 family endonuclease